MIRLSMLGAVDLRGAEDKELRTLLAQHKRLALLAYLAAVHPSGFHLRDTLLALLWPDLNQEHARAALRQALYVLRHGLGEQILITCGDAVIALNQQQLWCDVTAFEEASEAGNHALAMSLYGGELLAGFHLSRVPEFERWLDSRRTHLAGRAAAAASALADSAEREGNLAGALEWTHRLVAISPDDERVLRREVALLNQLGDRIAALRVYHEFARRLETEYEMHPAPETEELISAIRGGPAGKPPFRPAGLLKLSI